MTKPVTIAVGIAAASVACAAVAVATGGIARGIAAWTAAACAVASLAYLRNRPEWLGKARGGLAAAAILALPYLLAFRVACRLMGWWRGPDRPTRVAPGVWVSGRIDRRTLPPEVAVVVDLVAEYAADRAIRRLPGYRSLPVLDGGCPPDPEAFARLVCELAAGTSGDVLIHCDSGRGRAPTFAAALLVARGDAADAAEALALLRARRPVVAPTRSDLAFLETALPLVRAGLARPSSPAAVDGELSVQ
jgi:protein-tyrosine phosphatase